MSLYIAAYDISEDNRAHLGFPRPHRLRPSHPALGLRDLARPRGHPRPHDRALGSRLSMEDAFILYPIDDRPGRRRLQWQAPPTPGTPSSCASPSTDMPVRRANPNP